jgi:hypothetical protein
MGTTSTLNRALIVSSWAFYWVDFGGDMLDFLLAVLPFILFVVIWEGR